VDQQLFVTIWVVSKGCAGLAVLAYVESVQPQFVVVDPGIGVGDRDLGLAQRLDFGALEDNSTLKGFGELELVAGATVRRDHSWFGLLSLGHAWNGSGHRTSVGAVLRLTPEVRTEMLAHAVAELPMEACGMFSARSEEAIVDAFHPMGNAAESAEIFALDGQEMIDLERQVDAAGRMLIGVMHSHTETSPYPSPTDVHDAGRFDPFGVFRHVIVSLRDAPPVLRAFSISGEAITEVPVELADGSVDVHDDGAAVAAVVSLPRPSR